MGRAVTHGIVENHGCGIAVASTPGRGTTFTILLPETEDHATVQEKKSGNLPPGSGHVLFVDDEESMIYTVPKMLENIGYSVTATTNSPEALRLSQQHGTE